jgi:short-subunit dehydrogenase
MVPVNYETAAITGASSGIGEAFARYLASRGHGLILIARRYERLSMLAHDLRRRHSVEVEVIQADLSDMMDIERVEKQLANHPGIGFLVNNAGFGMDGTFADSDTQSKQIMINVHIAACVRFANAVLPAMVSRRRGAIINVSSLAAFLPRPRRVMYCSTKAFLVTFSRAMSSEVAINGVRVLALCPGYTRTEFHSNLDEKGQAMLAKLPRMLWMSPEEVVRYAFKALDKHNPVCVPGIANQIILFAARSWLGQRLARYALYLLDDNPTP